MSQQAESSWTEKVPPATSSVLECCICLEKPKKYGLMPDCDHVCCIECISEWRKRENKDVDLQTSDAIRCCPVCRTKCAFIVCTLVFPVTADEKQRIISDYKAKIKDIPCRYFLKSKNMVQRNRRRWNSDTAPSCPFGDECFYSHNDENGIRVHVNKPPPRPERADIIHFPDGRVAVLHGLHNFNFHEEVEDMFGDEYYSLDEDNESDHYSSGYDCDDYLEQDEESFINHFLFS